jgi:hypothetical protein
LRTVLLLTAASFCACGQSFEWWQTTDIPLLAVGGFSTVLHTQVRTRVRFHDIFHARVGPVVRFAGPRRWNIAVGYYFQESEEDRAEWRNNQRTFVGADRSLRFASGSLGLRTMVEHHFGGSNPQDLRVRQLVQWIHRARLTPYGTTETISDRHGFMVQRFQGGIRPVISSGFTLDIGCLYDVRMDRAGGDRLVIHTALRPRRRER